MHINGSTALVTGGTRGIGAELTKQLVAKGANVIVVGRDLRSLEKMVAQFPKQVSAFAADLTQPEEVDRLLRYLESRDLSILINNAASQTEIDLLDAPLAQCLETCRSEIALNLDAPIALCIGALPLFKPRSSAAVINITSGLAIAPKQASATYSATKAGLRSFTKALRYQCREHAPHIQITEAIMALVDTDMTQGRGRGKITAAQAARSVIKGLEKRKPEIWVGKAKLLKILNRLSPRLVEKMMR